MINLLSEEQKKQLRAARDNDMLLRYAIILVVSVILVISGSAFGYLTLESQQQNYIDTIDAQKPEKANYRADIEKAQQFKDDLSAAKGILQNEIAYSDILIQIAKAVPSNTRLQAFQANNETLKDPLSISLDVPSYSDAVLAKDALIESSYFSGAKLLTVDSLEDNYVATIVITLDTEAFVELKEGEE